MSVHSVGLFGATRLSVIMARCHLLLLVVLVLISTTSASPVSGTNLNIPEWAADAFRAQTLLTADTDISKVALCGANDVFNTLAFMPEKWRMTRPSIAAGTACIVGRCLVGTTDIHSQDLSVSDLLSAGVRRLGLNMHAVPGLSSSADEYRFCRGDDHFFTGCTNLKMEFSHDICAATFGVPTLTADTTGCTLKSATITQGLMAISSWIDANADRLGYDVIVIDLSDFVTDTVNNSPDHRATAHNHITNVIENNIASKCLTAGDLAHFRTSKLSSNNRAWPTPRQIVDMYKKKVVMIVSKTNSVLTGHYIHSMASASSSLSHGGNSVKTFLARNVSSAAGPCPSPVAPFQPVFESRKLLLLNETNQGSGQVVQQLSNEHGPNEDGVFTNDTVQSVVECGLSPSLDRVSVSSILSSCIWTYSEGAKPATSGQVVLFNADQGWTTSNDANQQELRKACQSASSDTTWMLSDAGGECPATFQFAVPNSPQAVSALRLVLAQSNVMSVLLPSDVDGVTEGEPEERKKKSNKFAGIGAGVSVAAGVGVSMAAAMTVAVRRRRMQQCQPCDTRPVVQGGGDDAL